MIKCRLFWLEKYVPYFHIEETFIQDAFHIVFLKLIIELYSPWRKVSLS